MLTGFLHHDQGDTIISNFKNSTSKLADVTVLPRAGIWHDFLESHPRLLALLQRQATRRRIKRGIPLGPSPDDNNDDDPENPPPPSLTSLAAAPSPSTESDDQLARRLAAAIRGVARDLKAEADKGRAHRYSYEEWVEFTKLIRFTAEEEREEEEGGLVDWDWIGEDSPMMAGMGEAEFVLDRLCESLGRYLRRGRGGEDNGDGGGIEEGEEDVG